CLNQSYYYPPNQNNQIHYPILLKLFQTNLESNMNVLQHLFHMTDYFLIPEGCSIFVWKYNYQHNTFERVMHQDPFFALRCISLIHLLIVYIQLDADVLLSHNQNFKYFSCGTYTHEIIFLTELIPILN